MPFTIDTAYTLGEVLKSYDPAGKLHHIIDVFSDKRPLLEEAYWTESNAETYHEMLRNVNEPSGAFMRIGQGYDREGVDTLPIKEQLALIGSMIEIPKKLMELQKDPVAWREQHTRLHIRGMMKNFTDKFYTGSAATDPKEVDGLCTRYNALSLANVADSTTADVSATYYPVFIIKWGADACQLLYPKGGQKTFVSNDVGLTTLYDADSKPFPGYMEYFDFNYGIGVGNDVCVQRLANCDSTGISASANFEYDLIDMISLMGDLNNTAIYVGRQIMASIRKRLNDKTNLNFTTANVWERMQPTFQGLVIVQDDALSTAESAVT
jgi:hypothetical protein